MSEAESEEEVETKKNGSGKGLMLGFVLALLTMGGGFYVTFTGILGLGGAVEDEMLASKAAEEKSDDLPILDLPPIAFVPLDPIVISLDGAERRHLRFRAELEVVSGYQAEVETLKPRILDVLNTYLRAVDAEEFERSGALIDLRAQMLRRIQIVTGEGRVRDLLIAEFVVS